MPLRGKTALLPSLASGSPLASWRNGLLPYFKRDPQVAKWVPNRIGLCPGTLKTLIHGPDCVIA